MNTFEIKEQPYQKLNNTDLKIILTLLKNPSATNREIAHRVGLSLEGTRSSLKKMYRLFKINSSQNMRVQLILKTINSEELKPFL